MNPKLSMPAIADDGDTSHRSIFIKDETTGTFVVRPECRAKVEKAYQRALLRLKFSLYRDVIRLRVFLFVFRLKKRALKMRHARSKILIKTLDRFLIGLIR